jgi:serine/threonine protein kinase/Flp pilus assembly protein TadD
MSHSDDSGPATPDADATLVGSDALVVKFVERCRRGERPTIEEYLVDVAPHDRKRLLLALVKVDMKERWPAEPSVTCHPYLSRFPELQSSDAVELIAAEYSLRAAGGAAPEIGELARRFPDQINAIRERLGLDALAPSPTDSRDPADLMPGAIVGDYQIERLLGRGAASRVYLVRQLSLDRRVAIKVSRNDSTPVDSEARTLARLEHDHIVSVVAEQVIGDVRVMVMRYVPGVTLACLMTRLAGQDRSRWRGRDVMELIDLELGDPAQARPRRDELARFNFVRTACHIVAGIARGLDHAHRQGVLHRDVKPANILVTPAGRGLLMDFHIASRITPSATATTNRPAFQSESNTSRDDVVIWGGTPAYMAPEHLAAMSPQFSAKFGTVDARSDVFSLGVVFYELLSGRPPYGHPEATRFDHASIMQLLGTRLNPPPPIPRDAIRVSPGVDSILEKCLAPQPQDRYQTCSDLAEDLDCYLENRRLQYAPDPSWSERVGKWLRRHPSVLKTAGLMALLIVIGAIWQLVVAVRTSKQAEELVRVAGLQLYQGDAAQAIHTLDDAERMMDRNALWAWFGLDVGRSRIIGEIRRMAWHVTTSQLLVFQVHLGSARGAPDQRPPSSGPQGTPPIRALSVYHVLTNPDWRSLPQFQSLDPETQAQVEADVAELLLMQATDLLDSAPADATARRADAGAILARIPDPYRDCHTVKMLENLVAGGSGDLDPSPPLDARTPFDLYLMGVVTAKRKQWAEAIRYFDAALERSAREDDLNRYWTHFHRAFCADQAGDGDAAIADYGTCIGIDDRIGWPYHNLGLIYARRGQFDRAARSLKDASKRDRTWSMNNSVYVNLSAVELKLEHPLEALDAANDAITLDNRCAEAYANRGAAHAALGHRDQAIADMKQALELDPNCQAARENLKLLEAP